MLDFSLPCPIGDAFGPDGVSEETCFVASEDGRNDTFAHVDSIQIVELNRFNWSLKQESIEGIMDRDRFTFRSVLAEYKNFTLVTLPAVIIVTFEGRGSSNQTLRATWSIKFSNSCEVFPVIEGGEQTVATTVVSNPQNAVRCPEDKAIFLTLFFIDASIRSTRDDLSIGLSPDCEAHVLSYSMHSSPQRKEREGRQEIERKEINKGKL